MSPELGEDNGNSGRGIGCQVANRPAGVEDSLAKRRTRFADGSLLRAEGDPRGMFLYRGGAGARRARLICGRLLC